MDPFDSGVAVIRMRKATYILIGMALILMAVSAETWAAQQDVAQQFQGFNLQGYTDGGDKAWDLRGDTADILNDTIEITNVDANQYGRETVNITARSGVLDKTNGNIQLRKDVVITSETGARLTTDFLYWQKERDLVETDKTVTLTDQGMTASGTGLSAQPGLKLAKLDKDVTVEIRPKPDAAHADKVTITCDGAMEIDQKVNMAVFHDNVVAVQKDRTLKADKMDVYFDPETKQIEKVVCIGHVEIIQGGNATYAQKAVYNAREQTFVLTGQPKLILVVDEEEGLADFPN